MTARRAAAAGSLLAAVLLLSGCSLPGLARPAAAGSTAATTAVVDATTTPAAAPDAAPVDDLAQGSAHRTLTVPGEQFDLTVDYWSTTPVAAWSVLTPKTLHLSAHLAPHAGGTPPTVAFARVTTDSTLLGSGPLAGLVTATWTDQAPVVGDLPGYLVTGDYPYEAAVDLGGGAVALREAATAAGDDGTVTPAALVAHGVTGYELRLAYRVAVRNPGDAGFHVRDVTDALVLPLS